MYEIYQTNFAIPGGNCLQACVASIFELPLEDVPDFVNEEPADDWMFRLLQWTKKQNIYPVYLEKIEPCPAPIQGLCLLGVQTDPVCSIDYPNWIHCVVGRSVVDEKGYTHFEVIHDPNPKARQIVEIRDALFFVKSIA